MKILHFFKSKKLPAATARRASAGSAGMDFGEIPEPNMKLSRALLIVLLLHVVAVSGIIAFNAIKTRESSFVPPASPSTETKPAEKTETATHPETAKPRAAISQKEVASRDDLKPLHSASKEEQTKKPLPTGKIYVVKKGESPVAIAKKLKVSYDDLIVLNHIHDPRKLQIGQKLLIPQATKSKTTTPKATNQKKNKK
jgi:LysM repeat protein